MSASKTLTSLYLALSELAPGSHVCSIEEPDSTPHAVIISFVRIGLERGEQCVCVTQEGGEQRLREIFLAGGIDVDAALDSNALVLQSARQAGLKGDAADPYRMFTYWKKLASLARSSGFSALRGTLDMECIEGPGPQRLPWLEYEQQLTQLAEDSRSQFLCQYPRARFRAKHLLNVVRSHPSVIHRGTVARNLYHVASVESGEADPQASLLESLLADIRQYGRVDLARISRLMTLGELTASIAHEVKQPLAAILAYGAAVRRWLRATPPDIFEADAASAGIVESAHRARDVIARIRSLAGKNGGQREAVDINDVMEDAIALAQGELRQNKVILRTDLGRGLPPIFADRVQLQQVGLNLIMNAVEAMSLLRDQPRRLVIRTWNAAEELHVSVRDSGIGIPEDSMQAVFEPFYTTKSEGIGIGLSISRTIVQAHNGRLWIERNEDMPGVTAHFVFR